MVIPVFLSSGASSCEVNIWLLSPYITVRETVLCCATSVEDETLMLKPLWPNCLLPSMQVNVS